MEVRDLKDKLIEISLHGPDQAGFRGLANALTGLMMGVSSCSILSEKEKELMDTFGCESLDELKEAMDGLKEELRPEFDAREFACLFGEVSGNIEG